MAKKKPKNESQLAGDTATATETPKAPRSRDFQSAKIAVIKRSALTPHEKNPRTIESSSLSRLKKFIQKTGVIGTIEVNRRLAENGFPKSQDDRYVIVGGHQRVKAMDSLAGFPDREGSDYELHIAIIEVSPSREVEIVTGLNAPGMQGSWDADMLAELLSTPGVQPLDAGFDRVELGFLFDAGQLAELLGEKPDPAFAAQAAAEAPVISALEDIAAIGKPLQPRGNSVSEPGDDDTEPGDGDGDDDQEAADPDSAGPTDPAAPHDYTDELRARKHDFKDERADQRDSLFMFTLVANSSKILRQFQQRIGVEPGTDMIDLESFCEKAGIALPAEPKATE